MRKHSQHNNDERTHFFRKIYLLHFIRNSCESVAKGLCVRGELETEQTATYWPPFPLSLAALLSRSAGRLSRGYRGPISLCCVLVLSTASYLQPTEHACGTGLYNCLTPTCFLWASHLHPIQPVHSQGYTLIHLLFTQGYTRIYLLFTQVHLFFDSSAEGQYVTCIVTRVSWKAQKIYLLDNSAKYDIKSVFKLRETKSCTGFQPESLCLFPSQLTRD